MQIVFSFLLVLPVLVFCCDETQYMKDDQCCKMCGPGTRMKQNTDCKDPICQDCKKGEYQDGYTKETKCKLQPSCDRNLNFEVPADPSKTEHSPCQCIRDYHCSSKECVACEKNNVCKPGERISKPGTQTSDTECAPCPHGTFSSENAAEKCTPWTNCSSGQVEVTPGSPTSDKICEPQSNAHLGVIISVSVLIAIVAVIAILLYCLRKGRTGTACLEEKLQKHCPAFFYDISNKHEPIDDKLTVENEQPMNIQPEENTEEPAKQDDDFKYGLSANGMPVDQDHSKSSLLSRPETSPSEESF